MSYSSMGAPLYEGVKTHWLPLNQSHHKTSHQEIEKGAPPSMKARKTILLIDEGEGNIVNSDNKRR